MQAPVLAEDGVDVRLRPLEDGDAGDLLALAADPDHLRWCPATPDDTDLAAIAVRVERARAAWADERDFVLAVEVGGRCAGVVRLEPDRRGAARFDLALAPWARGRRAASAAARLLLVWGFAQVGLQVVHWQREVGDWSSRRLVWACGFAVEGTVRDLLPARDGGRRDAWVASLRWGDPLRPRSRWLDAVPLAADGLVLGPPLPTDVDRVVQACAAPSTQAWLPALPFPYTVLDAVTWIGGHLARQAAGTGVDWAVRAAPGDGGGGGDDGGGGGGGDDGGGGGGGDPAAGQLLATVGLFNLDDAATSAEIGYWCHPDARSRGVTSRAVRLVARHALTPVAAGGLGLARLDLKAAAGNAASRRAAQRAGFREVGVEREGELLRHGQRVDFVRYDLLAHEVRAPR